MKERSICRLVAMRGGRKQSNSESLLCGMCEIGRLDEGVLEAGQRRAPCGSTTKIRVRLSINAYLFCERTKGKSQLHCVNSHFHSFTRRGVRKTVKFPKFTPHKGVADLSRCANFTNIACDIPYHQFSNCETFQARLNAKELGFLEPEFSSSFWLRQISENQLQ